MNNLAHKTIKLHEATQGEITLLSRLIALIKPVPYGSTPADFGAKTFIAYKHNSNDVVHYYVKEEIAEIVNS